jgi:glucokinase
MASGLAIRDWYLQRGTNDSIDRECFSAEDVFDLCKEGDELAQEAIARLGYYVGIGLANLTTILVPGTIAIGGGLALGSELFLEQAINIVRKSCREVPAEKVVIRTAALLEDVGLSGAAAVWLHSRQSGR